MKLHACFCIALLGVTIAQPALAVDGPFTLMRGPDGSIYDVSPTAQPRETADPAKLCGLVFTPPAAAPAAVLPGAPTPTPGPFETAPPFADGLTPQATTLPAAFPRSLGGLCTAVTVAATPGGLAVEYALGSITDSPEFNATTPLDNVDFALRADDYLKVLVCRAACGAPVVEYRFTLASHVFTRQHGRMAPWLNAVVTLLSPVTPAPTPSPTPNSAATKPPTPAPATPTPLPTAPYGTLMIPWNALELGDGANPLAIEIAFVASGGASQRLGTFGVTLAVTPAFTGVKANTDADHDHRLAALTQYDQYVKPATTPPPTADATVILGPGAQQLVHATLSDMPGAPAVTPRFPPITGDVKGPITQHVTFAGTLAQNAANVQSVQSTITGAVPTFGLSSASPVPSVPCNTCVTFQSMNSATFDVPKGSSLLLLPSKAAGSDDVPFSLGTLSDLYAGGALYYTGSSATLGILHTLPVPSSTTTPLPFWSDSAFGWQQQRGTATLNGLGVFVNRPMMPFGPAPPPSAPSGPTPPPGNITLDHLATYALALGDTHVTSNAAVISDVRTFARASYDMTDHAVNAFGGLQGKRTTLTPQGDQFAQTLMLGYRGTGRNYQQLDGTQTAFPTVSGPIGSLELAWQPAGRTTSSFDLVAGAHAYTSGADAARWYDVKATFAPNDTFGFFYEIGDTRLSPPLALINSPFGKQLGDAPYQGAVNQLIAVRQPLLAARDQSIGINVQGLKNAAGDATLTFTGAYDFNHVVPNCRQSFRVLSLGGATTPSLFPFYTCGQGVPTRTYTIGGSIQTDKVTFGASYVPTYYREARSNTTLERVYNVVFAYRFNPCDALVLTASNDSGILTTSSLGRLQNTFQAELDLQRTFGLFDPHAVAPTVFAGVSNQFALATANYSATVGTQPSIVFPVVYQTHAFTFYTGVRLGNRAFRATLAADRTCAPAPK